jgi:hypothetical protein
MAEVLVNGREPLDWELPALDRGRQCELERDCQVVAGLISEDRDDPPPGRPVTDLPGLP